MNTKPDDSKDDISCDSSLPLSTRLSAFALCTVIGVIFAFLAFSVITTSPRNFAILYSLANVSFISGTAFIVGCQRQAKLMFAPERLLSTLIYLTATLAVFLTALKKKSLLAMALLVVQVGSLCWYGLSYVPYAQRLVSRIFGL